MSQDRGADPKPPEDQAPDATAREIQAPDPPPEDDIRWLIYLAIGLVFFLALVAWSGFHNAMGH